MRCCFEQASRIPRGCRGLLPPAAPRENRTPFKRTQNLGRLFEHGVGFNLAARSLLVAIMLR